MACQCLRKIKGKWLSFCKYNKQRIMRSPRYLLTQRVRLFLEQGRDLNMPVGEAERIRKFLRWNSPHYYFFDGLTLSENSVVADIGVAEGNFGLKIVDRVKELYLFECDAGWIEALEATFEPWKDKVHIVNRFVSDTTSSDTVRLDDFFRDKSVPHILKLDVEGAEVAVLEGAAAFLKEGRISDLLVCTYHKKGDPERLSAKLECFNYTIAFSQGYMLFLTEGYQAQPPYDFRKGLLHATYKL